MATATKTNSLSSAAWATALLLALQNSGQKAPVTNNNIANIQRLIGVETSGNTAGFLRDNNPWNLNTYVSPHSSLPGGKIVNEWGVNVQVFNSVADGLSAYVGQLKSNPALLAALNNNAPASVFGGALSTSGWSSASYANASTFPTLNPFSGSSAYPGPYVAAPSTGNPKGWFGQWIEPVLTGSVVGLNNNPIVPLTNTLVVDPAKAVVGGVTSVAGFIGKITNPSNLKNVGIFMAGMALTVTGLVILFSASKQGKAIEGTAIKAAAA